METEPRKLPCPEVDTGNTPVANGFFTMSESLTNISGGYVYDPLHSVDGQVRDIWVRDGKIVPPPSDPHTKPDRTLNAAGLVVMPGGIDMHCHIAGPKVNTARKMRPEDKGNPSP